MKIQDEIIVKLNELAKLVDENVHNLELKVT